MRRSFAQALVFAGLGWVGGPLAAQQPQAAQDALAPLEWLVGRWQGVAAGQPGRGETVRTYERALRGRFLFVRNHSRYPPQKSNPRGEVHEDWGFISFDRARHRFVYRQFHSEGFVNTYAADSVAAGDSVVVFTSEQIENIAPGWRARETYKRTGAYTMLERFEMAAPGKDWELYSETSLRKDH